MQWQEDTPTSSFFPRPPIKLWFAMGHCMVLCAATLSSLGAFLFGVLAIRFPLENFTKNSFPPSSYGYFGMLNPTRRRLSWSFTSSWGRVIPTGSIHNQLGKHPYTRIESSQVTWYFENWHSEWRRRNERNDFNPLCCWGLDIGYIAPILECWSFKRDVAHLTNSSQEIGSVTAGFIATRQLAEVVGGARKLPWVWKGPMVVFGACRAVGLYRVMWSCFGLDAFWFWITLIDMY